MENSESKNVYLSYNKIARWYAQNRNSELLERHHLDAMLKLIPANASVLDVGCGTGKPIMEYLIGQNIAVTGVDASSEMLRIAKDNFPSVPFIEQDMRLLQLNKAFDGIIAWNSFFHLPAADQPAMFEVFEQHLSPGGVLMFTSGIEFGEAWGVNGGENIYHASLNTDDYQQLLQQHNFAIIKHLVNDPECGGLTVWMARYEGK